MQKEEQFENYWALWSEQEESNYQLVKNNSGKTVKKYLKKGYTHFDHKFWFPERKNELKEILSKGLKRYNQKEKRYEWWAFSPFLKVLLKTPRYKYQQSEGHYDLETKTRPICFASHMDGLIFGFYSFVLTKKYEEYLEKENITSIPLAYRSNLDGKCNIQFAKEVFDVIKTRKECTAIALDIKGYFDHIDHSILKEKWKKINNNNLPPDQYKLFKVLTEYSYVSKKSILKKYNINLKKLKKYPNTLLDLVPGTKAIEKFKRLRADKLIVTNNKPNKKNWAIFRCPSRLRLKCCFVKYLSN